MSGGGETWRFGGFRLDAAQRLLHRGDDVVALRPKTLEVLLLLLRRAGEVISKDELLAAVWQGNAVSEYVLTTCISELRSALRDDRRRPIHLKTVHGSGYQFIAEVHPSTRSPAASETTGAGVLMVGREGELQRLDALLQAALAGQRQIVFITGEMGIGKTTLADGFVASIGPQPSTPSTPHGGRGGQAAAILVARGQCIEQFGAGEPYMPILEAVGRLGRDSTSPLVIGVLRQHAPAWLVQIAGLLSAEERAALRRELPPQTQEYVLRQIADGIEALAKQHLLVLLLEDLHLSDHATLELVAALALRRGACRLLIVGTFREADEYPASTQFRRLQQQLLLHRQCEEIALRPLQRDAVGAYLAKRFAGVEPSPELARMIFERTEGNPLFVGRLIDQLIEDRLLTVDAERAELQVDATEIARHVPASLRAMIEQRVDSLADDERAVLEAACVAGVKFWSGTVAAALHRDRAEVEQLCTRLTRRHGLLRAGDAADSALPDLGASYCFNHALYQQVIYERVEVTRRQRLHVAIAEALRADWGERAAEIAAELASHLERGGALPPAMDEYERAAQITAAKGADREAVGYFDRALALLDRGARDAARSERRLALLIKRGPSVLALSGHGSQQARDNYAQALDLARQLNDPMRELNCLGALSVCQQTRGNLRDGEKLALDMIRVARHIGFPEPVVAQLHNPLSQVRMYRGEVEESLALSDAAVEAHSLFPLPAPTPESRTVLWADVGVLLHCQRAAASFALGRVRQAGAAIAIALRLARELDHPFNLAYALCWAAAYEDGIGQWETTMRTAEQAMQIADTYGFAFWGGVARICGGHALARSRDPEAGASMLRSGIELWRSTGGRLAASLYYNLLADVCLIAGDCRGAGTALDQAEAHIEQSGERVFEAETHRLRAEWLRCSGGAREEVEQRLSAALTVSRRQGTKLWEVRAALAVYRFKPSPETRRQLADLCAQLEAEPEIPDLAEARIALSVSRRRS